MYKHVSRGIFRGANSKVKPRVRKVKVKKPPKPPLQYDRNPEDLRLPKLPTTIKAGKIKVKGQEVTVEVKKEVKDHDKRPELQSSGKRQLNQG